MTKEKREQISERLRAARASAAEVLGRIPIPAHQTSTLCQGCFQEVFEVSVFAADTSGTLHKELTRVDPDGTRHRCAGIPHDTDFPPPGDR